MVQSGFAAFGRLTLAAACLALAGCGGKLLRALPGFKCPDGWTSPSFQEAVCPTPAAPAAPPDDPPDTDSVVPYQVLGYNVDHLEMTDIFAYGGSSDHPLLRGFAIFRQELDCNGNQCVKDFDVVDGTRRADDRTTIGKSYVSGDDDSFFAALGLTPYRSSSGPQREGVRTYLVNDIWYTKSNFDDYANEQIAGVMGQHSSIYAYAELYPWTGYSDLSSWPGEYRPYYFDDGFVNIAHAAAFGERHERQPSASATWYGDMRGVDTRFGGLLQGNATLVYSPAANTINVEISDVRQVSGRSETYRVYSGSTGFVWRNLPVNSDGSFYMRGHSNDRPSESPHPTLGFVDGDFYGPNAAETAGVFERDSVAGAWLAER